MKASIDISRGIARCIVLIMLVAVAISIPTGANAQTTPGSPSFQSAASSTDGLFLHLRFGGHGMAFDGVGDADGGGIGLRAGYGFSNRFTLYLGIDGAGMNGGNGFLGHESDDDYGMVYVELGGRFHFRSGRKLVPYADAALSVIGLGYEGSGAFDNIDIAYGGAGLSLGGGALYFLSPTVALDAGMVFTPGSLMEREVDGDWEDADIKLTGARIHFGLSFYPFR